METKKINYSTIISKRNTSTKLVHFSLISILSLLSLVLGTGCNGGFKGLSLSSKTIDSIEDVESEMNIGMKQILVTFNALDILTNNETGDMATEFKVYSKELKKLESIAKKVASRNQSLRARAEAYFNSWQNEAATIKSEKIKAVSDERRETAKASFTKMKESFADAKTAFSTMMDELKDIQLYLSNDLTKSGIDACRSIAKDAKNDAEKVEKSLRIAIDELIRVKKELLPTITP